MLALFPVIRAAPMIEIRAARYPDDARAVEAIFREYIAAPTVSLEFQDYDLKSPHCPASTRRRAGSYCSRGKASARWAARRFARSTRRRAR